MNRIEVQIVGVPRRKWRPAWARRAGARLHPAEITDAWYAASCPKKLDWRGHGINVGVWLRWRVACVLRGAK